MRTLAIPFFVAPPLAAQGVAFTTDVGSAQMRFADTIHSTSFSVTPALRIAGRMASLSAAATLSELAGASSNSGTADASLTALQRGMFSTELEGVAGGSAHSDGTRTGQMLGSARLHLDAVGQGVWLGAGAGTTWDGTWRTVRKGDAGAWFARGPSTFMLSVSPTVVDDTIAYADVVLGSHHEISAWELDASLGMRTGHQLPSLPANSKTWGNVSVALWALPNVAVVASGGTYPVDFTQGYPGGRFISLGLRFRARTTKAAESVSAEPVSAEPLLRDSPREFDMQRVAGDQRRIAIYAPGARSVEISGDFTEWTPVALAADARGWWTVVLPISRGAHQVAFRVNGGEWRAPSGLTLLRDEFGGVVGFLDMPD